MRILLTGGAGFIGSHIAEALAHRGHKICIVDNLSTGHIDNLPSAKGFHLGPHADIIDPLFMDRVFKEFKPDAVCHQAAQASLLLSHTNPFHDATTNIMGTIQVIEMCKRHSVRRMVLASTMAVFDETIGEPFESTPPCPNRPYGISKLTAETYLRKSGLDYIILRYGNVFGPRQRPIGSNQVIARFFDHVFFDKPFKIFGDGLHSRDFVYVKDVARANVAALEGTASGIFHIGTGKSEPIKSVLGYAQTQCQIVYPEAFYDHFEFVEYGEAVPNEPAHLTVGSMRRKELGWRPKTELLDGLRETAMWWRDLVYAKRIHLT